MKKKLLLINPVSDRNGFAKNLYTKYPPLSLGIIAALTPKDWDVEIRDENFYPFTYKHADLVALTAFTSNVCRAYELASAYRKNGIHTVMGGIHATVFPDEAAQYIDTIVIGDAETSWRQFINDFENGTAKKIYKGEISALKDSPVPRHDLFSGRYIVASVQTSRGCFYNCDFCTIPIINEHQYRQRPVDNVLNEIEKIKHKAIFFVDDNLVTTNKIQRQNTLELFRGMIDRKMNKYWHSFASIEIADDDEMLYYAVKSGCKFLFIGFEAEDNETLKAVNKKGNIKVAEDKYKSSIRKIHKKGIGIIGSFIFGYDTDTLKSIKDRARFIRHSSIDAVFLTPMTPFPGTRLYKKYFDEKRLLHTDSPDCWKRYDWREIIIEPKLMPHDVFSEEMHKIWTSAYSKKNIYSRYIRSLINTRNFEVAYWTYLANKNYKFVYCQ
jgi:radical SAM superfamily enzyme YgiQ (UPF0313 family)